MPARSELGTQGSTALLQGDVGSVREELLVLLCHIYEQRSRLEAITKAILELKEALDYCLGSTVVGESEQTTTERRKASTKHHCKEQDKTC